MKTAVVIPTFNRREILLRCLEAMAAQTVPREETEVVVVDDGSSDGSPQAAREFLGARFPHWQVLEGPNRGPAHARNRGIRASSAPLLLFLGDDMIPHPDLLREHLRCHEAHPQDDVAVLGYSTWHPDLQLTSFMEWLDRADLQFGYHRLRHGDWVDFWHFYSSNLSLKRSFLPDDSLFDTDFPYAAYEDTEFGHRLEKRGLRILYNRNAVTFHYHPMTLDSFCRRMERVGESAVILFRKIPQLERGTLSRWYLPIRPRHLLVWALYHGLRGPLPAVGRLLQPRYFKTRAKHSYRKGLRRGRKFRPAGPRADSPVPGDLAASLPEGMGAGGPARDPGS